LVIPLAVAAAIMVMAPMPALAVIQGSVHDVLTYNNALDKKSGSCSQCHLPHKAGAEKLFGITSTPATGWLSSDQPISLVCYYCHNAGTTFIRAGGGAEEVNPFGSTNKHGYTINTLTAMGDIGSLPGTVPVQSATLLKCTSCHDVHNNANRPFLRYLSGSGATDLAPNCATCHVNRVNEGNFGTANTGNHPTNQALSDTGGGATPMQGTVNAAFSIAIANPGSPNAGNWNLGGHRADGTTTGNFNCATCHAVHANETTDFGAADGDIQVGVEITGNNNLLVASQAVSATGTAEPVCIGCHNFTTQAGPGATTTFSHPIGTSEATWSITGLVTTDVGYRWGNDGTNDIIICESCHDIHFTTADAATEGATATNQFLQDYTCNDCHSGTASVGHHPAGVAVVDGTDYKSGAVTSTDTNWVTRTQTTTTTAYVFPGGIMTCSTCHASGTTSAHNITGQFPAYTGRNVESDMCVDCHTFNPSLYTDVSHGATSGAPGAAGDDSTHYVGPISASIGTKYKRTAAFSSGAAPKYSPDGTDESVICESCHTLKFKTVTARSSDNKTAINNERRLSVGLLLEASGNNQSEYDTSGVTPPTDTVDLCTGCHGPAPGGSGTTHPSLATMTTGVSTNVTVSDPFTTSSNSRINCDSCHRPHDAAGGSGALILESAGTDSTRTTFQGATVNAGGFTNEGGANFCSRCHTTY
jgi:nitrate/TMAO reductase-like tetraheme cytochrome c subunit